MKIVIFGIAVLALTACGNADIAETTADIEPVSDAVQPEDLVQNVPYPHYCFKSVGQIGGEPRRGETCRVNGGGASTRMESLARPVRNTVSVSIVAPSLETIGIKSVGFLLNRGAGTPKFSTGINVMDQVKLSGMEMDQTDLPDRMVFVSDLTGKETLFSWTMPDAAILRERGSGFDFPGYEIVSAVLTIDRAIDMPVDEEAVAMQKAMGMIMGEQYIEGTLNISLIPMGSKGEQFGPATFEFATTIDWGYVK